MSSQSKSIKLHSQGGRLFAKPLDILTSDKAKDIIKEIKESRLYQNIKKQESKNKEK